MMRLRWPPRDFVTLSLSWLAACASVESTKGPDTLAPTVSVDLSLAARGAGHRQVMGFELSSRVNQPQCLDVPGDERKARKCICAWGSTCLCRVKVKPRSDSCLVQSMTEKADRRRESRMEGFERSRGSLTAWAGLPALCLQSATRFPSVASPSRACRIGDRPGLAVEAARRSGRRLRTRRAALPTPPRTRTDAGTPFAHHRSSTAHR